MIVVNITCPHCKTTWAPESVAESVYCKTCKIFITKYKMSMSNGPPTSLVRELIKTVPAGKII